MRFEVNRRFFVTAGSVLAALFLLGLTRDLLLERKVAPSDREAPPIVIEGLDVVRDVEGDIWTVRAERVVKRGDISDAEVLDVIVESSKGNRWTVLADRGKIFEGNGDIFLESAEGTLGHSSGELEWRAAQADWHQECSLWDFPAGFEAKDDRLEVSGKRGAMSMEGALRVEEGAVATWKDAAR